MLKKIWNKFITGIMFDLPVPEKTSEENPVYAEMTQHIVFPEVELLYDINNGYVQFSGNWNEDGIIFHYKQIPLIINSLAEISNKLHNFIILNNSKN